MKLGGNVNINLTSSIDDARLPDYLPKKIKELLIKKNQNLYLGKTIPCGNGPNFNGIICFKLKANTSLAQGLYITIIGNNLDFIYTIKIKIDEFWDQEKINNYPYTNAEDRDISFKPFQFNGDNQPVSLPANIMTKLRESGNLVFINPDTFV